MGVASLPAVQNESSTPDRSDRLAEFVAKSLAEDLTVGQMAKKLTDDPHKQRMLRKRIRRMTYKQDPKLAEAVRKQMAGDMMAGLPATLRGVIARGKRGRTDAAKLLFEASGFHNPRVKHEHSGDINITVSIPRPSFEGDTKVVDAEVVEDPAE